KYRVFKAGDCLVATESGTGSPTASLSRPPGFRRSLLTCMCRHASVSGETVSAGQLTSRAFHSTGAGGPAREPRANRTSATAAILRTIGDSWHHALNTGSRTSAAPAIHGTDRSLDAGRLVVTAQRSRCLHAGNRHPERGGLQVLVALHDVV